MRDRKTISFIIPILNEEKNILYNLPHYHMLNQFKVGPIQSELVFVDGGSTDQSQEVLLKNGFSAVSSERGRSRQLNTGAKHSTGDVLVFLHADTQIPKNVESFASSLIDSKWGFFKLVLSNQALVYRIISSGINLRSRLFKYATGDQVIFFNRNLFFSMGAYADIALMEDLEITRRAKKICSPVIINNNVVSSSRRWEKNGVLKTIFFMWFIQICYGLGVREDTLAEWYYPNR